MEENGKTLEERQAERWQTKERAVKRAREREKVRRERHLINSTLKKVKEGFIESSEFDVQDILLE